VPARPAASLLVTLAALALGQVAGGADAATPPRSRLVSPAVFARVVAARPTVTINVHVPDEGSIPGTDLWIPFDRIAARRTLLPPRSTRLAVYCRSGRMSAIAVRTFVRLGFTGVVELRGGMEAWQASGRKLLPAGTR
jgi:phage shock protein E